MFVIWISLAVTLIFGFDSIDFARQLWHNSSLRAIANAKAQLYVEQGGASQDAAQRLNDLDTLSVRFSWYDGQASFPSLATSAGWTWWVLKILGLGMTFGAVTQGSSFWYDILRRVKGDPSRPPEPDAK